MNRGKDDEKMMGPMFPRLHVNDTEKGGPRAPPRNKMALYEQLSIPSQRFNNNVSLAFNPSKVTNLVPASSSSQGTSYERNLCFPPHVHPPTPSHPAENLRSRQPDGGNPSSASAQIAQRKKVADEDDFIVPVFVHSARGHCLGNTQSGVDGENPTSSSQSFPAHSIKIQSVGDKDQTSSSCRGPNMRQDTGNQREGNLEMSVPCRDNSVSSFKSLPSKERIARPDDTSSDHQKNVQLQPESSTLSQCNDSGQGEAVPELTRETEKGNVPPPTSESHSREDLSSSNEPGIESEHHGDKSYRSVQFGNGDKSDGVSETSMVDSISTLDISPDDIVGVIGQKRFWKARKTIVNQQRLFAVQVFELHRLIKVQRLIAASPHLLLEESTFLEKPSVKVSTVQKLPSEYVVTPPVPVAKRKADSEKPNHNLEYSAENVVGKTSLSSVKNGSLPSNYAPYAGNPTPVPVTADAQMAPWCFQHSVGHQWLLPVVSPSEGLVYKPYNPPGFSGSHCGGCGPFGVSPLSGNFINLTYGFPASHHPHQGAMPIPGVPPGHGYFPPYGMPVMNPAISSSAAEQLFAGSGSHGQTDGANINLQHQSSCNMPAQRNGSFPHVKNFHASKDTELQRSTASSPGERVQGVGTVQVAETRDSLPPYPLPSASPNGASQPPETEQPRRVIKVVPHNRISASESAARIFQSIQEERKQYDAT